MTSPREEQYANTGWHNEAAERHASHGRTNGDRHYSDRYEGDRYQHDPNHTGQSLAELFSDLSRETQTLINQEIALARLELQEKVADVGKNAAQVAVGGAVLYAGVLGLMFAAIYALSLTMEPWLAALLVGLVVAAIGGVLVYAGINALKQLDLTPRRTVATLQENAQWLKRELN